MEDTRPITGPEALHWLAPVSGLIYKAFEYGVEEALSYFETKQKPIRPLLFAALVRWNAIEFLNRDEHKVIGFKLIVLTKAVSQNK